MAKSKQKDQMPAGIRNKLVAAICMLMVSCIMLVTSTYAWFTLSTAPEVKNISTTVAGNGSLELALMPTGGTYAEIQNGYSGTNGGGTVPVTTANISWGNLITLNDASYGLTNVTLLPSALNVTNNAFNDATKPLSTVEFGSDGRPYQLVANTGLASWNDESKKFDKNDYGVRAIGTTDTSSYGMTTFGYVIDLAVRLNTTKADGTLGKLLLESDPTQRIYADGNSGTLGGGSYMEFTTAGENVDLKGLMTSIRVTFVQNYGLSGGTPTILGTAKLDTSSVAADATTATAKLYLYDDAGTTKLEGNNAILISELPKNTAQQISAIVWLDGSNVKNGDVGTGIMSLTGKLNLQFATDVDLNPSINSSLKGTAN